MTEFALLFSAIAFSVLISADLAASERWARRAGHAELVQALDLVFWSSWVGLLVLPTCMVLKALEQGITWTERAILAVLFGIMISILLGLVHVRLRQKSILMDAHVRLLINRDKKLLELQKRRSGEHP